jgi:hypothetical protein
MPRILRRLAAALFLVLPLAAQIQPVWSPHSSPASPTLLQPLQVAAGAVEDLIVPNQVNGAFEVVVVLGSNVVTLALTPHDVRGAGYQLLVDDGLSIHAVPAGPSVTYQGAVLGVADSAAAITLQNGQLKGIVRESGHLWGIQPATESDPTLPPQQHIVYDAADNWLLPYSCGVVTGPNVPPAQGGSADVLYQADLAFEIDFPQYSRFNNATNAQNDALTVVNGMDLIYRRDCSITFLVGTVLVRTTVDPYTSTDAGTLLGQFQNWWNAHQGGVSRDVAMMFSGRSINGNIIGIAYLSQVCQLSGAYGVTETMYNGTGTNITMRIGLQSHEMGHLWSAQHCDAAADCRIMCSGLGGCSGNVTSFSPAEAAQIVAYRQAANCLTVVTSTPVLTSLQPTTANAFGPGIITVNGSNLTGVNQVTIGTQVVTTGIQVISDIQARVTPPDGATLGLQALTVTNPSGTSNALAFTYTERSTCLLFAPSVVVGGTNMNWHWGGHANDIWFLVASLGTSTSPIQGWPVLNGFSILQVGSQSSVGTGSYALPIPQYTLAGLTATAQVIEIDPVTLNIASTSNLASTLVFN